MTIAELHDILASTGIPVAYRNFAAEDRQTLPAICYYYDSSDNFLADDRVYVPIGRFTIELYTKYKELSSEASVEKALSGASLPWTKNETYLESELCYEIIYEIEVILNGE